MRLGLVIAGVIVVVVGAALLFVPLVPQTSESVQSNSSAPYYIGSVAGFSLTGSIPVSVSWTSTASVEIVAAAASCAGTGCTNVSQISGATLQTGTSGSFTLNQPDGGSIVMGVVSSPGGFADVTFKITTALTTVGTILIIVGILLLILGVVLKGKKPAPTMAPPMPAVPAGSPPSSPAPPVPPPGGGT